MYWTKATTNPIFTTFTDLIIHRQVSIGRVNTVNAGGISLVLLFEVPDI
jgi:hypothetical protein